MLSLPLEYMGYKVEMRDVRKPLPLHLMTGRYAGIATWFMDDEMPNHETFRTWIIKQLDDGMRIAIIGSFGFVTDAIFLKRFGLKKAIIQKPLRVNQKDSLIGFETRLRIRSRNLLPLQAIDDDLQVHLGLSDARNNPFVAICTGKWGGMAINPYVLENGLNFRYLWIVDPFKFLKRALQLPTIPAPDVTTENGRRLLMSSIDGDGAVSKAELPGTPYAIDVIYEQILNVYNLPTTVSIIEGEIGPQGLYPNKSPDLENIARKIFRLPHVELATHTFSHPFEWRAAQSHPADPQYRLPIPGYQFNLEREIAGSAAYINERLAPPGKSVKVVLWTGEANPSPEAIALCKKSGLWNLNGGNTKATNEHPSITEVSPVGIEVDGQFQAYAPIMNENIFTGLWKGPFYGFQRVIETLQLTDFPRRLKPLEIYYHFYSGSKLAALMALKKAFNWALLQENMPIFVSEYTAKVKNLNEMTMSKRLDGGWQIKGLGDLRTLRLEPELGWPDLKTSTGVIGVREIPQGRYVSFNDTRESLLYTTPDPPQSPHLLQTNARVLKWKVQGDSIHFNLKGHVPVILEIAGMQNPCQVFWKKGELNGERRGNSWRFEFLEKETGDATLCP